MLALALPANPWRSPLLLGGLLVWTLCLAVWGVVWGLDPTQALAMGATFAAFLVSGKLGGIPVGLSFHLHPALVGAIVFVPDIGAVLFAYPLTERGVDFLGRWSRVIHKIREQAHENARNKTGLVARYESWGLFLVSLTPVAFISPLVVSAIGQVMGLTTRRVLVPVIAGMVVMTVAMVAAFATGFSWAAELDARLPLALTGLIVGGLLTWEIVTRMRARKTTGGA